MIRLGFAWKVSHRDFKTAESILGYNPLLYGTLALGVVRKVLESEGKYPRSLDRHGNRRHA